MKGFNLKLLFIGLFFFSFGFLIFGDVFSQTQGKAKKEDLLSYEEDRGGSILPEYAPGEVLIGLKEGFEDSDVDLIVEKTGIAAKAVKGTKAKVSERIHNIKSEVEKIKKIKGASNSFTDEQVFKEAYKMMPAYEKKLYRTHKIKLPAGVTVEEAIIKLENDPAIEYAEPNYLLQLYSIPNDPYYSSAGSWGQSYDDLWGIKKIQSSTAWDIAQGEGVTVAVIDSGVEYNHEDLASNILINNKEIPNNGIDDDGNGYVDDVRGWDFSGDGSYSIVEDKDPMDTNGHGTHVSGTIAAIGNNGIGVIGVAPKAKIMPVKIFPNSRDDVASKGIKYAVDNGAKILSCSWGRTGFSKTISDAFNYAYSKGVISVVAAGNENEDSLNNVPACLSSVITVASSDHNDVRSDFSNFGPKTDIAAPGGDSLIDDATKSYRNILSLRAAGLDAYGDGVCIVGTKYYRARGTSMAAPHVSGLAALILSKKNTLKNEEVRQIIRQTADDIDIAGWDLNTGYGRINAYKALDMVNKNIVPSLAHIASYSSDTNAKTLTINGSASGNGFSRYKVEYGAGIAPAAWTLGKTATTAVTNGVLATLSTAVLQPGYYSIKLSVTSLTNVSVDRIYIYYDPNFVLQWWETTNTNDVRDIAVDEKNNFVYVLNNSSIIKFDTNGKLLKQLEVALSVRGITVDNSGNVWTVGRAGNYGIIESDANGVFMKGFFPLEDKDYLDDIKIDNDGNIYVAYRDWPYSQSQPTSAQIRKLDKNGNFVMDIGSYGTQDGQFNFPCGIAINRNSLYVVDKSRQCVQEFNKNNGRFIRKWGSKGALDGQFFNPVSISADGFGKLYVTDPGNCRVQIFDRNGNFLYKFGQRGSSEGQFLGWFNYLGLILTGWNGVSADSSMLHKYVYVTDTFTGRIQKFLSYNRPPVITSIGNKTVAPGQLLKFALGTSDPDNDVLAFTVNNLPAGAQFVTVSGEKPSEGIIPGLYGDADLNGRIATEDASLVSSGILSDVQKIAADVNGNGKVDTQDSSLITGYVNGTVKYFPVILQYGDVNLDRMITSADANAALNPGTLSEIQKIVADVNGDGKVDTQDALLITDYVNGVRNYFPTATKRFFVWKPTSAQLGTYPNVSFKVTDGKQMVSQNITITVGDTTPPTTPVVTDGGAYTSSTITLSASWTSSDPESGIAGYSYKITQDSIAGTIIRNWTSTGTTPSVTATGLTLAQGKTYYFTVVAENPFKKLSGTGYSNGIKVDTTPPTTPVVTDGGTYTTSRTTLAASWTSSDPESGIKNYSYKITQDSITGTVIKNWTSTGITPSVTATGLTLQPGKKYYFTVIAENPVKKLSAQGYSNGIIVQ